MVRQITDGKIKRKLTIQTSIKYTGRTVLLDTKGLCSDYLCQDSLNLDTGFRGEQCLIFVFVKIWILELKSNMFSLFQKG